MNKLDRKMFEDVVFFFFFGTGSNGTKRYELF